MKVLLGTDVNVLDSLTFICNIKPPMNNVVEELTIVDSETAITEIKSYKPVRIQKLATSSICYTHSLNEYTQNRIPRP
jgi:hypothetical protein